MANCGQACPYNTLDGCKVKEYNAICPLTNMATPVTEYRMTNADRIRAMSDEELADWLCFFVEETARFNEFEDNKLDEGERDRLLEMLKQPAEGE